MKIIKLIFLIFGVIMLLSTCSSSTNKIDENKLATKEISASGIEVPIGISLGYRAPDIEFPSPDGTIKSVYSLRGKLVLIDFWASWCPPCRMENPNLVNNYRSFKDKKFKNGDGFTIFSVSLDQDKSRWISAIKSDKLEWATHVCDLKGWQSVPAALYQVTGIPNNFLIDGKGVIVASNLRGEALNAKLNELLR
jgi:thiol-disulfide isomerase/thioredoxin